MTTLSTDEYQKVRTLAESAAYSTTKALGKQHLVKLEFQVGMLRGRIGGRVSNLLSEIVGYASSASGSVNNKEQMLDALNQKLFVLESMIEREQA